jgi:hypothetical protein
MSYKVVLYDESGAEMYSDVVKVCLLSSVNVGCHVEARCFSDGELMNPLLAGAIVAADGLVEQLFDEVEGLRDLCDECRDFCLNKEVSDND